MLETVPTSVRPVYDVVITESNGAVHRMAFEQDVVSIGRSDDNDLVLPAPNVSGVHCRLVCRDSRFILVDVGSTNGTYVNGLRIEGPTLVRGIDVIGVGSYRLQIDESSDAEAEIQIG